MTQGDKNVAPQLSQDAMRNRPLKISVSEDLVLSFKASCEARKTSMAKEIARFMSKVAGATANEPKKSFGVVIRRQRRKAVSEIISRLRDIAYAEEAYKENIPENLMSIPAYENAQKAIDALDEAILLLDDAFS